jgi:transcriptional regulator with XRE-family HTH domain
MDAIKQTRKALGATQAELAAMLGLNQSTVSRLESGALDMDARTSLALEALVARGRTAPVEQKEAA